MTALDDLISIIDLAILTEYRSDDEQRALLRAATSVQRKANSLAVTNKRTGPAVRRYDEVRATRDPESGKPLGNDEHATKLEDQARRWEAVRWMG